MRWNLLHKQLSITYHLHGRCLCIHIFVLWIRYECTVCWVLFVWTCRFIWIFSFFLFNIRSSPSLFQVRDVDEIVKLNAFIRRKYTHICRMYCDMKCLQPLHVYFGFCSSMLFTCTRFFWLVDKDLWFVNVVWLNSSYYLFFLAGISVCIVQV